MGKKIAVVLLITAMTLAMASCGTYKGNEYDKENVEHESTYSKSVGNSVNGGYAVQYGDGYLFGGYEDHRGLYYCNESGIDKLSDGFFREMTAYGDELYYVNGRPGYVERISLDTFEKESVAHNIAGSVVIYGDTLYYRMSSIASFGKLCAVDLLSDQENQTQHVIADGVMNYCISGDHVFYCNMADNNKLWKMKLDGTDRVKISDAYAVSLVCDDEYLYFADFSDGKLKSYNISAGNESVLTDDNCRNLTLSGGKLFFVNRSDGRSLYSVNTDGTEMKKLADGIVDEVVAFDGKVFFEREKETVIDENESGDGELVTESLGYFVLDLSTMTETPVE